jgi:hypothetical protein
VTCNLPSGYASQPVSPDAFNTCTPEGADASAEVGMPCASSSDCDGTNVCAYAIADRCTATGSCQSRTFNVGCDAAVMCACDGTPSAVECDLPAGYASKPVTGDQSCFQLDAGGHD